MLKKVLVLIVLLNINLFAKSVKTIIYEKSIKHNIDPKIIMSIAETESNFRNIIGDKHLKNKAYGYFQIRQPAVNEINKVYKISKIKNSEDLLENVEEQVEYCILNIKHLIKKTKTIKKALMAYNAGVTGSNNGKGKPYFYKVMKNYNKYARGTVGIIE